MAQTREQIINKYSADAENLLAMLHDLQDCKDENYLSEADIKDAAEYLNLPYTTVHGVATFYSMYSFKPRGKNIVRVCQSPPCHLMGSTDISKELIKLLGVKFGETTACGTFTLEMTSCLGVCGTAPAIMIGDRVYGNLDLQRLKEIINDYRREK